MLTQHGGSHREGFPRSQVRFPSPFHDQSRGCQSSHLSIKYTGQHVRHSRCQGEGDDQNGGRNHRDFDRAKG